MAISILEQPTKWQPVYNPIIYRFSSDQYLIRENFKFEVSIQISKVDPNTGEFGGWQEINRLEVPVGPDGTSTIDIHKYLSNELTAVRRFEKNYDTTDVTNSLTIGDHNLRYRIEVKEKYLTEARWLFDTIQRYSDGSILRPEFRQLTPVNNHEFTPHFGRSAIVTIYTGNPAGEFFDGRAFTLFSDGSEGDNSIRFSDAQWNINGETTYEVNGEIVLATKVIAYGDDETTTTRYTWNGVKRFEEWPEWVKLFGNGTNSTLPDYIYRAVPQDYYFQRQWTFEYPGIPNPLPYTNETLQSSYRFITSIEPYTEKLQSFDYLWVGFNPPRYTGGTKLKVRTNNGLYLFSILGGTTSTEANQHILSIGIGPKNLEGVTPDTVLQGSLPMIDENTTFVEWWYSNSNNTTTGNVYSMKYKYTIEDKCSAYDKYSILFLDKWGQYRPFPFYLAKDTNVSVQRTNIRKNIGKVKQDWEGRDRWTYDLYDRGLDNIDTTLEERHRLVSDWVNDDENRVIQDLLESPDTYLVNSDGVIRAINITNSSFKREDRRTNQIFNYTINFVYSQKERTNI
jgi:hypothetical protein